MTRLREVKNTLTTKQDEEMVLDDLLRRCKMELQLLTEDDTNKQYPPTVPDKLSSYFFLRVFISVQQVFSGLLLLNTYAHTCINTNFLYVRTYVCIANAYTRSYVLVFVHTYCLIHVRTFVGVVYLYVHAYVRTYVCMYVHTYVCTYVHVCMYPLYVCVQYFCTLTW